MGKNENGGEPAGLLVKGIYLGYQDAKTYAKKDGTSGIEPAKVGIMGRDVEYVVSVPDDELAQISALTAKGDAITLEVNPVAPFGATGPVRFASPGVSQRNWQ